MTLHFPRRPWGANLLFMENEFILSNIPSENSSQDWWLNTLSLREIISSLNATVNLTLEGHKSNGFLSFFLLFILPELQQNSSSLTVSLMDFKEKDLKNNAHVEKDALQHSHVSRCLSLLRNIHHWWHIIFQKISFSMKQRLRSTER